MKRILLVEDTRELADLVQRELIKEGYHVELAVTGPEAVEKFATYAPDLVLLDWMLPQMDGLEVLRQIRSRSLVPILMLTARREETDRVVGLELGADDYLTKPFSMRELVARVRALLRRIDNMQAIMQADQQPESGCLRVGRLVLQPETYQVWVDGTEVDLTRTEARILHLLMRNPGRVFSRAYLMDTVWEQGHVPGDRSVDNAILRLRRKLGEPGDDVEAVWGVGYRLRKA